MYYTCIAFISLDSILKMNKKNYPQVYLEERKYKVKKINTPRFINIELETDSEPDVEADLDSNTAIEDFRVQVLIIIIKKVVVIIMINDQ